MANITRRDFVKSSIAFGTSLSFSAPLIAKPSKFRVAVIGRTGKGDYGHSLGKTWLEIDEALIVAVADEDAKGRAKAVKRLNAPSSYADYNEMLEKEKPDIVTVAPRWLDCHKDMLLACAEAGANVFVEKPMCRDLSEADEVIAAFEKKGLKLAVAHNMHYSPTMQTILKIINDGRLGDILELRGRGKEDKRGASHDIMNLGSHTFDLMRMIAGDPKWCFAEVRQNGKCITKNDVVEGLEGYGPEAGDEIKAIYRFSGKSMGYFASHLAKHGAGSRWGIHVYGSKGIITIGEGGKSPRTSWFIDDPTWQPGRSKAKWERITSAGVGVAEPIEDVEDHDLGNIRMAKDLIRAIKTDTQPMCNMYDGRGAVEMAMAVYESQRLNAKVNIPLKNRVHPLKLL